MNDGELIRNHGSMVIKWCAKCKCEFTSFPKLDEIYATRKAGEQLRKCCVFNKQNRLMKFLERQSPPHWIESHNSPEDIETMDEYYDRTKS